MLRNFAGDVSAVISIGLLIFSTSSYAEELNSLENSGESIHESMVVTAGRIKEKKEDVTANISVYTANELELLAVDDLSDLLSIWPAMRFHLVLFCFVIFFFSLLPGWNWSISLKRISLQEPSIRQSSPAPISSFLMICTEVIGSMCSERWTFQKPGCTALPQ